MQSPPHTSLSFSTPTAFVVARNGVPFHVRLVRKGERYGLNHGLTHEAEDELIEFYDQRFDHAYDHIGTRDEAIAAGAEPLGQFVARYYLRTLQDRRPGDSLQLDGGVPQWTVDSESLASALAEIRELRLAAIYGS